MIIDLLFYGRKSFSLADFKILQVKKLKLIGIYIYIILIKTHNHYPDILINKHANVYECFLMLAKKFGESHTGGYVIS